MLPLIIEINAVRQLFEEKQGNLTGRLEYPIKYLDLSILPTPYMRSMRRWRVSMKLSSGIVGLARRFVSPLNLNTNTSLQGNSVIGMLGTVMLIPCGDTDFHFRGPRVEPTSSTVVEAEGCGAPRLSSPTGQLRAKAYTTSAFFVYLQRCRIGVLLKISTRSVRDVLICGSWSTTSKVLPRY